MLIVLIVIFGYFGFGVFSKDIFGNLLKISLEVIDKVLQNMGFIGFEVNFQEHMMSDDNGERNPVQRTLLYPRLKQVRMVTNFLQPHQDIHHSG